MARILTGVQSTGSPHLGNILGAMIPSINMSNQPENDEERDVWVKCVNLGWEEGTLIDGPRSQPILGMGKAKCTFIQPLELSERMAARWKRITEKSGRLSEIIFTFLEVLLRTPGSDMSLKRSSRFKRGSLQNRHLESTIRFRES